MAIWGTLGAYFLITAVYALPSPFVGHKPHSSRSPCSYSLVIPPTSDDYYIFAHALGEAQFWAIVAVRTTHYTLPVPLASVKCCVGDLSLMSPCRLEADSLASCSWWRRWVRCF